MARYFLHVRYWGGLAVDEEGDDVADASLVRTHVLDTIHALLDGPRIAGIDWRTCTLEVTDEAGRCVLTLPFSEAERSDDRDGRIH